MYMQACMHDSENVFFSAVLPYSGKFSWVQNFAELPLRASEEIFTVLIFTAPARTGRRGAIDIALAAIFAEADLYHAKIFR